MRTTLDLPEDLINEAMSVTRINTKTKVIVTALEDLIRKSKRCTRNRKEGMSEVRVQG